MADNTAKSRKIKTVIIVLAVLLALAVSALAARLIRLNFFADSSTSTSPDNVIGKDPTSSSSLTEETYSEETSSETSDVSMPQIPGEMTQTGEDISVTTLSLHSLLPSDNQAFNVLNMFPGDVETRYYCVEVNHSIFTTLYFGAVITQETENISEIMRIRVSLYGTDKVLYDGTVDGLSSRGYSLEIPANSQNKTAAYYKIAIYLPTSAGNEYQNAGLKMDFNWWVNNKNALLPPQTGGDLPTNIMWVVVSVVAAALVAALIFSRPKDKCGKGDKEQ